MVEVADVAVLDAARERDRSHDSVADQRAADARASAKLLEIPGSEIGGGLQVVGRHERHCRPGEIDAVEVDCRRRIRTRVHDVGPNPANRELRGVRVLKRGSETSLAGVCGRR
jgi:hypothetical protein